MKPQGHCNMTEKWQHLQSPRVIPNASVAGHPEGSAKLAISSFFFPALLFFSSRAHSAPCVPQQAATQPSASTSCPSLPTAPFPAQRAHPSGPALVELEVSDEEKRPQLFLLVISPCYTPKITTLHASPTQAWPFTTPGA